MTRQSVQSKAHHSSELKIPIKLFKKIWGIIIRLLSNSCEMLSEENGKTLINSSTAQILPKENWGRSRESLISHMMKVKGNKRPLGKIRTQQVENSAPAPLKCKILSINVPTYRNVPKADANCFVMIRATENFFPLADQVHLLVLDTLPSTGIA